MVFQPLPVKPYWVLFMPNKEMTKEDLVGAGVPLNISEKICNDLAYLGSLKGHIVFYQNGEHLSFQGNPVSEQELVCLSKSGEALELTIECRSRKILRIK